MKNAIRSHSIHSFLRRIVYAVPLFFIIVTILSNRTDASMQLDRKYALETVGFIKAWDNVDGLFADYVADAYTKYFEGHTRFRLHDLSKIDPVLKRSNLPYHKIIDDVDILAEIARVGRTETVLRTKVYKEGPQYRFQMEWLHAPKMHIIAKHEFYFKEPAKGSVIASEKIEYDLHNALDKLVLKLPFKGHITGRDKEWVTVNIGKTQRITKGDTLIVSTLEDVKVHPLLKTLVEWQFVRTGKIIVDEVDGKIAFCKILDQEPNRQLIRFQKITKILPGADSVEQNKIVYNEEALERARRLELPKSGWIAGGPWLGFFSRDYSDGIVGKAGTGFMYGFKAETQIWLTRHFFSELELGYAAFKYSQSDTAASSSSSTATGTSRSSSLTRFRLNFGYTYLLTGDFYGPRGWLRGGYRSHSYSFPLSLTDKLGSASWGSFLFVGIGAELPLRDRYGAILSFDIGLLRGSEINGLSVVSKSGTHDVTFFVGGFYRWTHRLRLKLGLDAMFHGVEYSKGETLNHNSFTFTPSLVYYF